MEMINQDHFKKSEIRQRLDSLQTPVQSSSSLAGCREMAKYQGWRGVQGNFRGKVEERVQQKGNRRGGAGPGWLAAAPTTGPRKKQRKGGKVS